MSQVSPFIETARAQVERARNGLTEALESPDWPRLRDLEDAVAAIQQVIEDIATFDPTQEISQDEPSGVGEVFDLYFDRQRFIKRPSEPIVEALVERLVRGRASGGAARPGFVLRWKDPAGTWWVARVDQDAIARLRSLGIFALMAALLSEEKVPDMSRIDRAERRFIPDRLLSDARRFREGAKVERELVEANSEEWRRWWTGAAERDLTAAQRSEAESLSRRAEQQRRERLATAEKFEFQATECEQAAERLQKTRRRGQRGPEADLPPDEELARELTLIVEAVGPEARAAWKNPRLRADIVHRAMAAIGVPVPAKVLQAVARRVWEGASSRPGREATLGLALLAERYGVSPLTLRRRNILKMSGLGARRF